ncbi:hypothetical protein CNR22_08985 [Sphingobacteriaceae bacterium]|nr:hypothetical protein CNR22_08985 [Sphingobacteriaceae bacterium]
MSLETTLFFGNGINNLSNKPISWNHLLNSIKERNNFDNGTLPNTLIYERALFQNHTEEDIPQTEFDLKNKIAKQLKVIETNEYYKKLMDLKCKNYLTTNYDYALEKRFENEGMILSNKNMEDLYSIRRFTSVATASGAEQCKVWHLHGEIGKPMSIMLGFDQYCGSVSKIDGYIKGTYEFQENKKPIAIKRIELKLAWNKFDNRSWAELFFRTNVHILGFSMDFSETDIWWLLNKRARMIADKKTSHLIKNKIFFYASDDITQQKEGTLESFKVNVVKTSREVSWEDFYTKSLAKIRAKMR